MCVCVFFQYQPIFFPKYSATSTHLEEADLELSSQAIIFSKIQNEERSLQ